MAQGAPDSGLDLEAIAAALGGASNIASAEARAGRVLVSVKDAAALDEARLGALGLRGIARPAPERVHLLHPDAEAIVRSLK